ncbi:EamA family transporter RarD [Acinetobacter sp. c1-l78]|uniref:EamA family transporter RarD n=1 Tax=Acinetobacter sp. c1-l78 TaxID=3342803 RepID=UPI0035BAE474
MLRGIIFSVVASMIFGILYLYSQLLHDLNSFQVMAWRVFMTLPFVLLFAYFIDELVNIKIIWQRMRGDIRFSALVFISAMLCMVQLWLFMWGPLQGRGLQVSLGYFLLPLVMVLIGHVFFHEKLSKFQIFAVFFAVVGVTHEIWRVGQIAWETALVAVGYSAYFVLRKRIGTNSLGGFCWDLIFMTPFALYFIVSTPVSVISISFSAVMIGFGALSALGLGCYLLASRFLPFSLFGLLSYIEPVLLALAAVMIGEKIKTEELWTYLPIWFAVFLLAVEGLLHFIRMKKSRV